MENLKDKKILFLITQTKWGGAQKYTLELAQYFSQYNEVHLAFGEINEQNAEFLSQCQAFGLKTIAIKNLVRNINPGKDINAVFEIKKLLDNNNYHLVHLNSSKAGLIGALAAKLYAFNPLNTRLRLVYTAHGFVFNEPLNKLEKTLYKISEKFSCAIHHAIITVSEYDKQSALSNKVCAPYKMFTIHNGLDFSKYNFLSKEQAQEALGLSPDKKYFGTIASFYTTKGHSYLLEAIKIFLESQNTPPYEGGAGGGYHWVFIGDGPEQKNIEKLIAEYKLENFVTIIPPKNNDWRYLKAFDYFVLPSVKEGLPYTILEAALAKIPVIASEVGGIPEIISDEQTGLLAKPANPLSLAENMQKIVKLTNIEQIIENNYQNIKTNFDLQKTLSETENLYLKLFPQKTK
jgi:glycosyltransferase involved in cell wall biosynthesis